ncbi:hypothetical protein [uncultured Tenacibaculum sp.]|uniref:hypothetical protein n=1 Tax=uncultured Tenacibaculum sp. TaxID=174713 RepID=UPI0026042291|nr:hypothetical protein [uncultured Tenacibaculum sp.]
MTPIGINIKQVYLNSFAPSRVLLVTRVSSKPTRFIANGIVQKRATWLRMGSPSIANERTMMQ